MAKAVGVADGDVSWTRGEVWLEWINKSSRPELAKWLRRHSQDKMMQSTPNGSDDERQALLLWSAGQHEYRGDCICFGGSVVVRDPAPRGERATRREVFWERAIPWDDIVSLYHLDHAVAAAPRAHNERGAGRKPLSADVVAAIRQCRADGMSVRATAAKVGVSTATVQRYA